MVAACGSGIFPGVCVVADVCRDELLFGIDAEAAFNSKGSSYNSLAQVPRKANLHDQIQDITFEFFANLSGF
jgi:hypothetical protein